VAHTCNPSYSGGLWFKANPRQIVCETLSPKNPITKRAGEMAQVVGPMFKPQCHTKERV
jgi:hypothetical protein